MECGYKCRGLSDALFNAVQVGIVVVSADTRNVIAINPAACIMIGTRIEDVVGKPCSQYLCMDSCDGCPVISSNMMDDTKYIEDKEVIIHRKDGSRIYGLLTISSVLLGEKRLFINTLVDITRQKEMESERDNYLDKAQTLLKNNVIHLKNGVV